MARRASGMSWRARVITLLSVFATAAGCGALLLIPGNVGAAAVAQGVSSPAPSQSVTTDSTGQTFGGVPEVGALFTESAGALGTHFCTASVVHSTHGDLAVTAAHCLASVQGQQVVFVPATPTGRNRTGPGRSPPSTPTRPGSLPRTPMTTSPSCGWPTQARACPSST
jgi:hypothetical protein